MGKSSSSPKPDPAIGQAALMNARLGQEFLAFSKEQFGVQTERTDKLDELSQRVTEQQLAASKTAQDWAAEDRTRYKSVFQPLQDEFVAEAQKYGSEQYQNEAAAKARADVVNSAARQADQRERAMASMGVSPASGRFAGVERSADVSVALGAAGAENNARELARSKGLALKADAINLGNGLPSSAAGSLTMGVNAGSTAVGTATVPMNSYNQNMATMQNGYSTAMRGYDSQANILNNQFQGELAAWNAQQQAGSSMFSALGSIAGAAIMASSKDYKTDKVPVRGVLEAVRGMPVEEWSYKRGIADEGRHIGPYAEDFQAATGKGDGKSIPVVDAIGVSLGAIQELADKVDKLESGKGVFRSANDDGRWQDRYARKDWRNRLTKLNPAEEEQFQEWAARTRAPITDDYDMRGFWKSGEATSVNQNDGLPHFTDRFKTPLHESFSGESQYADPDTRPPHWNSSDQLVTDDGSVLFDEPAELKKRLAGDAKR